MTKNGDKYVVEVSDKDFEKIMAYLKAASPNEILGLAHVREEKDKLVVYDPFILPQTVSGAQCEVEPKDLVKFIESYERIAEVKCWWHSHVNMQASFSSCDRETSVTMARIGQMMAGQSSLSCSIVLNLRREYEVKIDVYKPVNVVLAAKLDVVGYRDPEMLKAIEAEVKTKCSTGQTATRWPQGGGSGHSGAIFPGGDDNKIEVTELVGYTLEDLFGQIGACD